MFVALLYLVLDGQERTVTLCSAGQTQPIHFSPETGAIRFVETEGDTFPLGILDDADYLETKVKMSPGDKVILYTDGIVEAMNEKEEIFGFERLMEVVEKSKDTSAEGTLSIILNEVNAFVGSAPQHDDLTAIVLVAQP
jgi:sigma-B regulation protein RsbU (phosphoserine phosphatase)